MPRRTASTLPTDPVEAFTNLAGPADPTLVHRARSYRPRFPEPTWPDAAPMVALGILAAAPRSPEKTTDAGRWCTIHVTACLERGVSRTVSGVWGRDAIEHTLATVGGSVHLRANLATTLRRASAALTAPNQPARPARHARRDPLAPYTSDELAELVDAATTATVPLWRARVCLLITMHAGAGLRPADVKALTPDDVSVDARGVLVRVPGARERLVPVRIELEQFAAATHDMWRALAPDGSLLPRRDPSSSCFERTPWPNGQPRASAPRLRATWTAWVLAGGASVPAYLTAADIISTASWYAPVRLLPDLPQDEYLRQVRGTTAPFTPGVRALDGQPWPAPTVPLRADTQDGGGR